MSRPHYVDEYVELLSCAMTRSAARNYVLGRLGPALMEIGIDRACIGAIEQLLMRLAAPSLLTGQELAEKADAFHSVWRPHLNRAYLSDYEAVRWRFIRQFVFDRLSGGNQLGRCLDVGCGRGCVTSSIVTNGLAVEAVGIDAADFASEWHERRSAAPRGQRFERVPLRELDTWLNGAVPFDTILLFYVLHHSDEYFAARTLGALRRALRPGGRIVVLEDSLVRNQPPIEDPRNLSPQWNEWARVDSLYSLSVGYDVQAILDFVAVQLLAGFADVRMPGNYKPGTDWRDFFAKTGFRTLQMENIGFPAERDIDVPQAFFVLTEDNRGNEGNAAGPAAPA